NLSETPNIRHPAVPGQAQTPNSPQRSTNAPQLTSANLAPSANMQHSTGDECQPPPSPFPSPPGEGNTLARHHQGAGSLDQPSTWSVGTAANDSPSPGGE